MTLGSCSNRRVAASRRAMQAPIRLELSGVDRGGPGVVGGLGRDDLLMNEAPEHSLDVAVHGREERVLGEISDQ